MARTPDNNDGPTILRKLIKAREAQMIRLENEIKSLKVMAEAEDARQTKIPLGK